VLTATAKAQLRQSQKLESIGQLAAGRKQHIQRQPLDLNEIVRNLAKMMGRMLGEDVVLDLQLDAGLPSLNADPSALERVLMNLAVNARDAIPHGGRLRII